MRGIAYVVGILVAVMLLSSLTAPTQYAQVPQDCPDGVCYLPIPSFIQVQKSVAPPVEVQDAPEVVVNPIVSAPVVLSPIVYETPRAVCMPGPVASYVREVQPVRTIVRGVCSVPVRIVEAQPVRRVLRGACRLLLPRR